MNRIVAGVAPMAIPGAGIIGGMQRRVFGCGFDVNGVCLGRILDQQGN
jgi:hypothetical protein